MSKSLSTEIINSRWLLENPYAHLDENGTFSALPFHVKTEVAKSGHRFSEAEIKQKAKELREIIWKNRKLIWGANIPSDPTDMLDPSVIFEYMGYDYDLDETLGQYRSQGQLIEVAGVIDSSSKRVRISRQFSPEVRLFTLAHELGHAVLHEARGLHRDRSLDGTTMSRDAIETEADKFATNFLMPEKLVVARFASQFATECFALNEATVFALSGGNLSDFQKKCQTLRDLSRILAKVEYYNGLYFTSLSNQFRVSPEAMAIRLEELELLAV